MRVGHKIKRPEKLNLVPILDSVFIFIFFLLMSAQFVDVYEIGSSLPVTKEVKEEKNKKDPLNLTLEISKDQVLVKTGLRQQRSRSFSSHQAKELKQYLTELKRQHPSENTIILRADRSVPFQRLVSVIDSTHSSKDSKIKLFEQIVFDNSGVIK